MAASETLIHEDIKLAGLAGYLPAAGTIPIQRLEEIYEQNKHRIYSLSFWMAGNELQAEELTANIFRRAFRMSSAPSQEVLDRALITELRETRPLGLLTLHCREVKQILNVRGSAKRTHLEEAVLLLPVTERLIFLMHDVERYSHSCIARLLGLTQAESQEGLHQARLRVRELLAAMY